MTRWIGAAIMTFMLMFSGSAAISSAAASPLQTAAPKQRTAEAADFSARRHIPHHHRYVHRPYYPYYYDRPYYYAPAPFFPFLGLGYGPWW
jgi:hypothetical protein